MTTVFDYLLETLPLRLLSLFILALILPSLAFCEGFNIESEKRPHVLYFNKDVLFLDTNNPNLTINEVSKRHSGWKKTYEPRQLEQGIWAKITLTNKTKAIHWRLYGPWLNATAYVRSKGKFESTRFKVSEIFDSSSKYLAYFTVPLMLKQNQSTTLYFHYTNIQESLGMIFINKTFILQTESMHYFERKTHNRLGMLILGAMAFFSLYIISLYFHVKDSNYLFLGLFSTFITLFLTYQTGFLFTIIPFKTPGLMHIIAHVSLYCISLFYLCFIYSWVDLKQHTNILQKFMRLLIVAIILLIIVTMVAVIYQFHTSQSLRDLLFPYSTPILNILIILADILILPWIYVFNKTKSKKLILKLLPFWIYGVAVIICRSLFMDFYVEYRIIFDLTLFLLLINLFVGMSFAIADVISGLLNDKMQLQSLMFKKQKSLTSSYQRFVPEKLLKIMGKKSIEDLKLGDNIERNMSVLFSDIRDYTAISETMDANKNFQFLNDYLAITSPVIIENKGFIDKYIGDAIMAIFASKVDDAIDASIDMHTKVTALNQLKPEIIINIGIGINSGLVAIGTLGEPKRMDGTVISDAVNLASRIEGLTKYYGASILISSNSREQIKHSKRYQLRFVDRVVVKGKKEAVDLYEVLNIYDNEMIKQKLAMQKEFLSAFCHYEAGQFAEALVQLEVCLKRYPKEKHLSIFMERCKVFKKKPPAKKWRGAYILEFK